MNPIDVEVQNSLVTLMTLGEIKQGYRVYTTDGTLKVYPPKILVDALSRAYNKETRTLNVNFIQNKLLSTFTLIDTLMSSVYSYITSKLAEEREEQQQQQQAMMVKNISSSSSSGNGGGLLSSTPPTSSNYPSLLLSTSPPSRLSGGGMMTSTASQQQQQHRKQQQQQQRRQHQHHLNHHIIHHSSTTPPSCYHERMNILTPVKYLRQLSGALHACVGGDASGSSNRSESGIECLLYTYEDDIALCQRIKQIIIQIRDKRDEIENILSVCERNKEYFDVIIDSLGTSSSSSGNEEDLIAPGFPG